MLLFSTILRLVLGLGLSFPATIVTKMDIDYIKAALYNYMNIIQNSAPQREQVNVHEGRKYYKVTLKNEVQERVHSFVCKETGDVFKPASYKIPAKGRRYNLITEWELLKEKVDWAGSYLYR
jgi:hypothetical protein